MGNPEWLPSMYRRRPDHMGMRLATRNGSKVTGIKSALAESEHYTREFGNHVATFVDHEAIVAA